MVTLCGVPAASGGLQACALFQYWSADDGALAVLHVQDGAARVREISALFPTPTYPTRCYPARASGVIEVAP
jgi:hypothetical protein